MTSKERDLQNYNECINRATKLQDALDTGVLNEEAIQVLRTQICNYMDNAKQIQKKIDSYKED